MSRAGVLAAVLAGTAAAALVGAATLPGWADKLPESPVATILGDGAREFQRAMSAVGLTRPYDGIRSAVRWVEARKFPTSREEGGTRAGND